MKLDKFFYFIGLKIAQNPVITIVLSISVMALILSGLLFLEFEVKIYWPFPKFLKFRTTLKNYGSHKIPKLTTNKNSLTGNSESFFELTN